jgi:urease accessory protein
MKALSVLAALAIVAAPSLAWAHADGDHMHGFAAGLAHPISGLDHLAAAAAVGAWAGWLRGRAIWLLPAAFITAMAAGIFTGATLAPHAIEVAIALSVIGLGLAIALAVRFNAYIAATLVACAGLAHGAAHAVESPPQLATFAAGALVTTAMLHAVGVLIATRADALAVPLRAAGAATALFGVALISGVLAA